MGAQVPVLSLNQHPNPSQGQQEKSIAFGKPTSQRIYPRKGTHKIGLKAT